MIGIEASEDDNQTNQNTTYKVSLTSFMYIHNGVKIFIEYTANVLSAESTDVCLRTKSQDN